LHPTQLYEAAAEGLAFVVLYRSFHRPHRAGAVMGLYLMLYSVARFAIDFLRHHDQANPWGGPLSTTQWLAFGLFAVGVWLLLRKGGETQISPTRNAARPQSACR
jgi:phosphatidylglycerol:prolipoprotein diacylglycerol transferase